MGNFESLLTERNISKRPEFYNKFLELLEAELNENFSDEKAKSVNLALENAESFMLVEEVKTAIYQLIYLSNQLPKQNIPAYISNRFNRDFISLNQLFLLSTGVSIKKYINQQKIELVKEILIYDKLRLAQIASKLKYRNVAHLVNEFTKGTGVSPDFYRLLRNTSRGNPKNVGIV